MKSQYRTKLVHITAAGLVGMVLGAAGVGALHAQTATAPAFFVGNVQEVLDAELFKQYEVAAGKVGARYGSHVVAAGVPLPIDMPRSAPPKGSIIIVQFPSMKNLKDWWNSPEYAAIRPMREKATVGPAYALQGLPAP